MPDSDPKSVPPSGNPLPSVPRDAAQAFPAAPAAPLDAPPIFKGSVSHWMGFKSYVASVFVMLIGIAALIFGSMDNHEHFKALGKYAEILGKIGFIGGLALIAASGLMILYIKLSIQANRYTITARLIERETGILVKKVDALDLGRVKHVDMKQSFLERMLNVGTIEVFSGDGQELILRIEDIPDPRPVYEKLRDAVIDLSRRRGIIVE